MSGTLFDSNGPRVRSNIRFEANIGEYDGNIYSLRSEKTGFIRLFRIEVNPRILYAKRIKTEANIPC